jgi:hypothetical protein
MKARGLEPANYAAAKPTLRIELDTRDTGERKEMFRHMARHIITTQKQIPLEGSRKQPQEAITDGWYIDINEELSCDRHRGKNARGYTVAYSGPFEKTEFKATGEGQTGFLLQAVTTTKGMLPGRDGSQKKFETKSAYRVTEFEEGPLDSSLFEIPASFRRVEKIGRNPAIATSWKLQDLWEEVKAEVRELF